MKYRIIKTPDYIIGYTTILGVQSHERHHDISMELFYDMVSDILHVEKDSYEIDIKEGGKPYVKGDPFYFNISHCRGLAVCAISRDKEVGVDVEVIKPNREATAKRVMSDDEYEFYKVSNNRDSVFCKIWTYKECLLKLTGEGIRKDLRLVDSLHDYDHIIKCYDIVNNGENFIISCGINKD